MYPDDATLLARGRYSTLSHERREQLRRLQEICSTMVTEAQATLRDAERMPPEDEKHLNTLEKCVQNARDARERIVKLATDMVGMKEEAWPS